MPTFVLGVTAVWCHWDPLSLPFTSKYSAASITGPSPLDVCALPRCSLFCTTLYAVALMVPRVRVAFTGSLAAVLLRLPHYGPHVRWMDSPRCHTRTSRCRTTRSSLHTVRGYRSGLLIVTRCLHSVHTCAVPQSIFTRRLTHTAPFARSFCAVALCVPRTHSSSRARLRCDLPISLRYRTLHLRYVCWLPLCSCGTICCTYPLDLRLFHTRSFTADTPHSPFTTARVRIYYFVTVSFFCGWFTVRGRYLWIRRTLFYFALLYAFTLRALPHCASFLSFARANSLLLVALSFVLRVLPILWFILTFCLIRFSFALTRCLHFYAKVRLIAVTVHVLRTSFMVRFTHGLLRLTCVAFA